MMLIKKVMTAATFWSLLLPALEIAESMYDGYHKMFSLIPVLIGLFIGAAFVHFTDVLLPDDVTISRHLILVVKSIAWD